MSCGMKPVYINFTDGTNLLSKAGGEVRKYVVTPKKFWGLGLGLEKFMAGLSLDQIDANTGVTVRWQWSLDGCGWQDGDIIVTEKTTNGAFAGVLNNANQMTPFCRVVVEVRDTTSAGQVGANISTWGYYQYS